MLCFPILTSVAVAEEERAIKQSGLNRRLKKVWRVKAKEKKSNQREVDRQTRNSICIKHRLS